MTILFVEAEKSQKHLHVVNHSKGVKHFKPSKFPHLWTKPDPDFDGAVFCAICKVEGRYNGGNYLTLYNPLNEDAVECYQLSMFPPLRENEYFPSHLNF